MKWLWFLLLSAFATSNGVEAQVNCTYAKCQQLLASLDAITIHSRENCIKYNATWNATLDCVNEGLAHCHDVNSIIAIQISTELISKSACSGATTAPSITPTSTTVDCSFTECGILYYKLNINETSYCTLLAETHKCLNITKSLCQDEASIINYDTLKSELNELPSCNNTEMPITVTPMCIFCDDLYNEAKALQPSDANYCRFYTAAKNCVHQILGFCSSDDNFFNHALWISKLLDQLPGCNITVTTPPNDLCLNDVTNDSDSVELNDNPPQFIDKTELDPNCATKQEENFYHCGFYSYSHLRVFNSDDFYTCSSPGLWALFSHPSLKVTILNVVPGLNGPYTLVDEVNVVVSASSCSQETIYHASAVKDYFPTTFEDGTSGVNGLELFLNDNGTSAHIRIPWIDTTIAIHKLAGHIGVVVQSPASVATKSVGLCSLGCPDHSKLTVSDFVHRDFPGDCTQEAAIACSINNLTVFKAILDNQQDQYFLKCIFDVLQSNNPNSSWISLAMVDSWFSLGPTHLYGHQQKQTVGNIAAASSSRSTIIAHITMVSWCLSLYAMLYMLFS